MRFVATVVVVKMRNSLFALVRQMTSSRQSPNKSAERQGVDLVELFEDNPPGERMELDVLFT